MDGVVEVASGRVRGVRRGDTWSFSGVPYAGSTEGRGRWRPPSVPTPWTGIRDCDRFGAIAPQTPGSVELSLGGAPDQQSEDCLTLNVWTPELDDSRRPVMVWIHGGSFTSGSGAGSLYRGGLLARDGDVVVVTLNYRLGLLGFLAHPALEEPDQSWLGGKPWTGYGNWGLADQIAALQWVHDHIAGFGGDPANVTVFGESAGGMSISALLACAPAAGLFHRAIIESGPPYTLTSDQAANRAERLVAHLGVPLTRQGLTSVPTEALIRAATEVGQSAAQGGASGLLLMPVIDGGLLTSEPREAVASGSSADVPLLIGTNRDESSFFTVGNAVLGSLDEAGLMRWASRLTSDEASASGLVEAVRTARTRRGESVVPKDLWVALATECVFRIPSIRLADAHAAWAGSGAGTYVYLFTWESPAFGGGLGSCHALEIPFVFGTVSNPAIQTFSGGGAGALALSAAIRRAWTGFARTGQPPGWPAWDAEARPTTVLGPWGGSTEPMRRVDGPRNEELEIMGGVLLPAAS